MNRKVIILSGLPGSGKSHWAQNRGEFNSQPIREDYPDPRWWVFSADNFFIKEGRYQFDPTKIAEAHQDCLKRFCEQVRRTHEPCTPIVDNTNLSVEEIAPYYAVAKAYGWDVEIIHFLAPIEVCIQRNIHGVPEATIRKMAEKEKVLCDQGFPPYWKVTEFFDCYPGPIPGSAF